MKAEKNKKNQKEFIQIPTAKITLAKKGIGKRRSSRKFADIEGPNVFDLNNEKEEVLDILENTNNNVFLTGRQVRVNLIFLNTLGPQQKRMLWF